MTQRTIRDVLIRIGCEKSRNSYSGATCIERLRGTDPEAYKWPFWSCSVCQAWVEEGFDAADMPRDASKIRSFLVPSEDEGAQ